MRPVLNRCQYWSDLPSGCFCLVRVFHLVAAKHPELLVWLLFSLMKLTGEVSKTGGLDEKCAHRLRLLNTSSVGATVWEGYGKEWLGSYLSMQYFSPFPELSLLVLAGDSWSSQLPALATIPTSCCHAFLPPSPFIPWNHELKQSPFL